MDKVTNFRNVIKRILTAHAQIPSSLGKIETIPLFDDHSDNYLIVDLGWDRTGRVHSVPLHLRIHNEKIWVEVDNTDCGIVQELLDAGISKEQLVLGFHRPERRELMEFAVA
jgi:hypothetical protein